MLRLLYFLWKVLLHTLNTDTIQQSFDLVTSGVRSGIFDSVSFQRKDGVGRREVGSTGGDGGTPKTQPAAAYQRHGDRSSDSKTEDNGRTSELHYWIGQARSILPSVSSADRLSFLIAHLEGPAREEVRYAPSDEKDCIDKIFTLLVSAFGENRSNAQLKRELYERVQVSRESVRKFSIALLEISEGLTDKVESKDNILIEVFCENLLEPQIKREIKRLVRTDPNISFGALRSEAIQLEEDGLSGPNRCVRVREVHEPHHASDDPSPLERIAAQLELLATTQSEIVSLLLAQQQTAAGWLRDLADRNPSAADHFIVSTAGEQVTPRIHVGSGQVIYAVPRNSQVFMRTGISQIPVQCGVVQ